VNIDRTPEIMPGRVEEDRFVIPVASVSTHTSGVKAMTSHRASTRPSPTRSSRASARLLGSGGTYLRRVTPPQRHQGQLREQRDRVPPAGHGLHHGIAKSGGTLNGLLSGTSWMPFIGSLLRKDPAATSAISSLSLTIAASGSNYTITRGSGDFLTGGIKIGDVIQLSGGSLAAGNVAKNIVVVGVTATVITGNVLKSGGTLTAEGPIASCTVTVMGKKSWVPTSGHTNDYYTFEDFDSDLTLSRVYPDMQIGQLEVQMPATGNVTVELHLVGLGAVQQGRFANPDQPERGTDDRRVRRGGRRGLCRWRPLRHDHVAQHHDQRQRERRARRRSARTSSPTCSAGASSSPARSRRCSTPRPSPRRSTTRPRPRSSWCWPMPAPTPRTRWRS
jgi:hypothetical protein